MSSKNPSPLPSHTLLKQIDPDVERMGSLLNDDDPAELVR